MARTPTCSPLASLRRVLRFLLSLLDSPSPLASLFTTVLRLLRFVRWWTRSTMVRVRWKGLHALGIDRPSTWSWLMWAGVVSLSLNVFCIIWTSAHRPPANVFTNWEKLHDLPLVDEDALRDPNPPQGHGNVIATSFFTDEFATAIATLGHSLNRANTTARRLMLYIPEQVSPRGLCLASVTGFQPHPVDRIAPPDDGRGVYKHFIDQYTKLRLWELEEAGARGVVYLDADTLVTRNFDELFTLPYGFAATPDVYTNRKGFVLQFNAGVLFLRPSAALFRDIVRTIATAKYWRHEAEQALLNTFYAKDVVRLPYAYNANLAIKARSPSMWEGMKRDIRVIHYTMVKPFTRDNKDYALVPMSELEANARRRGKSEFGGIFAEEMETWAQAWKETYATYGEKLENCMALSNRPGHQLS